MAGRAGTYQPPAREPMSGLRCALMGYSRRMGVRGWSGFGWQIILLVPPGLLYFMVRELSAGQESAAFRNAAAIVEFQQRLGLNWEAAVQQRVLDREWLVAAMNWIYMWGHFPLIIVALVLLFGWSRREFVTLRNALVASGAVGLACFALYPVAPPRLFDPATFVDTLGELSRSYQVLQNPKITNQFAAVPSFHVGWNLLVACAVWRACPIAVLRLLAVLSPLLMMCAVVLTANHWLIDIVAGLGVAIFGVLAARCIDYFMRRGPMEPNHGEAGAVDVLGGAGGARTHDRAIMSRAL